MASSVDGLQAEHRRGDDHGQGDHSDHGRGQQPNLFWSEEVGDEHLLEQARPTDGGLAGGTPSENLLELDLDADELRTASESTPPSSWECIGITLDCKILHGDNKAALSATNTESGPWRTRHLRIRAHGLREAVRQQLWQAKHLPGTLLAADGLTQTLMGVAFANFRNRLGATTMHKMENNEMDPNCAVKNVKVPEEFAVGRNFKVIAENDASTNAKVSDENAAPENDDI